MNIQWYPGHMTKARRAMEDDIKLVDIVVELLDARVPNASRNPDLLKLTQNKKRILILNKSDLADPAATEAWSELFASRGEKVIQLNSRKNHALQDVKKELDAVAAEKKARDLKRGIKNRPVRMMVVGIPNVGKSTLINSLAGHAAAKTGDKPGVTKGNQWIRLNSALELLDTPGILWPRFEDASVGLLLALIGSVNEEILVKTELAAEGVLLLNELYPGLLDTHYGTIEAAEDREDNDPGRELTEEAKRLLPAYAQLSRLAAARNLLKKGGEPDTDRAAALFLNDLRKGALGRITLERAKEA